MHNDYKRAVVQQAEVPIKQEEVIKRLFDELGKSIDQVGSMMHQLGGRLEPVMRPPSPQKDGSPTTPAPIVSPMSDTLKRKIAALDDIFCMGQDFLSRLEL